MSPATAHSAPGRRLGGRFSRAGLVFAVIWYVMANTPSILPRPWWLQGLVAALSGVCGYVVGLALGTCVKAVVSWLGLRVTVDPRRARLLMRIGAVILALLVVSFPGYTIAWQRSITTKVGLPAPGWWYPVGSTLVALVVFALVILLWRGVAALTRFFLTRLPSRLVREAGARLIASALTVLTVVLVVDWLVQPAVLAVISGNAQRANEQMPEDYHAPTSSLRSGGPGSPESWSSLGRDGAKFVSSGPDAAEIRRITGKPAKEPIRTFVGAGEPLPRTAAKAMAELDRTHAWDREAILVAVPTSTGYINLRSVAAFEFLTGGDSAIVSMAYSDLPSPLGLIAARDDPPEVGRLLLDAVRAHLSTMPAGHRPKVYFTGESLGAYGADGAFASPDEMLAQTDGGLLSGAPMFSANRRRLTRERAPGSTSIDPVINGGTHIRFVGSVAQLHADEYDRPLGAWSAPRVVYLQHPSDPVAWWTASLLYTAPQWLRETRQNTPMAQMTWIPLVTFWQVTADMVVSTEMPGEIGHRYYAPELVPAWAGVLGVDAGEHERAIIAATDEY